MYHRQSSKKGFLEAGIYLLGRGLDVSNSQQMQLEWETSVKLEGMVLFGQGVIQVPSHSSNH